jgi:hypothetical protein
MRHRLADEDPRDEGPLDALTAPELLDCADKRLLSRKRVGRQPS